MKYAPPKAYSPQARIGKLTGNINGGQFLFPLKLLSAGTAEVEAATSFASRVLSEHGVGARQLHASMSRYIGYAASKFSRAPELHTINGTGITAQQYVEFLRNATGQPSLDQGTLYHLRSVLSSMRSCSISQCRQWCPICLEEMRAAGSPIYARLIWQVSVSTFCSVHKRKLHDTCPQCGKQQWQLVSGKPLDMCMWCNADLCASIREMDSISEADLGKANWVNNSLAEIIMLGCSSNEIADNAFGRFMTGLFEVYGKKRVCDMIFGHSVFTLRQWAHARFQPSLPSFLDVCAKTGVSAALLLREPDIAVQASQRLNLSDDRIAPAVFKQAITVRSRIKRDRHSVRRQALNQLNQLGNKKYVSSVAFAQMVGVPVGTLYYLAPEEMRGLYKRNLRIRRATRSRANDRALWTIARLWRQLEREGKPISRNRLLIQAAAEGCSISRNRLKAAVPIFRSMLGAKRLARGYREPVWARTAKRPNDA